MAVRKLPPSLFSAKARAPQSGCSTPHLHFINSVTHERKQHSLVRERQPLTTFLSRSLRARRPLRCPNPLQGESEC